MDAPCEVQRGILVNLVFQSMCPENWVHIRAKQLFLLTGLCAGDGHVLKAGYGGYQQAVILPGFL